MKDTMSNPIAPFNCPICNEGSMNYITSKRDDDQSTALFRISQRMGTNIKVGVCANCGLMLNFVDDSIARK